MITTTLQILEPRRGMLWLAAILLLRQAASPAGADPVDTLLSRNATYTVTGGGYVYTGQIQPGVNARASKDGIVYGPLVEPTDAGDELIDGDTSDGSMVHTTWSWHQPGKVINVTMVLPGESTVRRVRLTYPADTTYRPEQVILKTRSRDGPWEDHGRRLVHQQRDPVEQSPTESTFELDGVRCRELNFYIGGFLERVGVTEIEVWGDGPTASEQRGLIRAVQHVQTVTPPAVELPAGTRKLTKTATITLESSHPLTAGRATALIDGDRGRGIRIRGKAHQHWYVAAELDLGDTYHIDGIYVWMPGGRGAETGHVHEIKLAISPSADHLDWQTPLEPLVPVYWPTDDAPRPYVIPANGLGLPGRRVRVSAYLSGTGNITSILAMGEIEIWGRPLAVPVTAQPRLELRPVTIKPQPVGRLAPRWQALRDRRIRGIWISGDLDDTFGDTDRTKAAVLAEAGFNTVVLYTGVDRNDRSTAPDLAGRIGRNLAQARQHGLTLFAKWQFGSSHEEPYRRFVGSNGVEHEHSACPLQPEYIVERHVGRWAVECARLGVDGFAFDTEMYESDSTGYHGACFCDSCFKRYLHAFSSDWEHHFNLVRPEQRGRWIEANTAGDHYRQAQRRDLIDMFATIRDRCRKINPDFLFAHAPFVGHMAGLTHGLGTPERPVIVWSEREYVHGPESRTVQYLRRIRDERLPALYVCGHMLWFHDPETLARNLVVGALNTDGWWAWLGTAMLTNVGTDDPVAYESPHGRAAGTTAMEYLDAVQGAHRRLDELLQAPPAGWPGAELFMPLRAAPVLEPFE